MFRVCLIVPSLLLFASLVGCGDSGGLLPATGTVTYQGKPVEGASVTFQSETTGAVMGVGITDASGKYEIRTAGKRGAKPGKNLVAIMKQVTKGGASGTAMTPDDMKKMYQKSPAGLAVENQLPAKYADPKVNGLSADVQSGKSVFDFTLTD